MIIELCGLPSSGKTTFVRKLVNNLSSRQIHLQHGIAPPTYPLVNSSVFLDLLKGLSLCVFNSILYPKLAYFIFVQIVLNENLFKKRTYYKLFICLQYHINWVKFYKKLLHEHSQDQIVIIDGSPWNIINDFPSVSLNKIQKLLNFYFKSEISRIVIVAYIEPRLSNELMQNRAEQPIEPILYNSVEVLQTAQIKFKDLQKKLNERKNSHYHVEVHELFLDKTVNYYSSIVKKRLQKSKCGCL